MHRLFFGMALAAGACMVAGFGLATHLLSADLFAGGEEDRAEAVYIPSDFFAPVGGNGEVALLAGENIASSATSLAFTVLVPAGDARITAVTAPEGSPFAGLTPTLTDQTDTSVTATFTATEAVALTKGTQLAHITLEVSDALSVGAGVAVSLADVQLDGAATTDTRGGLVTITSTEIPSAGLYFDLSAVAAVAGEEVLVPVRSAEARTITGVVADISLPAGASFLGVSVAGGALSNFELSTDAASVPGNVGLVAATSVAAGQAVAVGDALFFINLRIPSSANPGDSFTLRGAAAVADQNLAVETVDDFSGTLQTTEVGTLRMLEAVPLSATTLEISFSDDLASAPLSAFSFSPELIQDDTEVVIAGSAATFTGLAEMTAGQDYRVSAGVEVRGDLMGAPESTADFAYFAGYVPEAGVSRFYPVSATATSTTAFEVTFSENIQPGTLTEYNVSLSGATVQGVEVSGAVARVIITKFSAIPEEGGGEPAVTETAIITFDNTDANTDILSTSGELSAFQAVTLEAFDLEPAGGPELLSATASAANSVSATFDVALLPQYGPNTNEVLLATDFAVYAGPTDTTNLVTDATTLSLSADRKTVTLGGIATTAGEEYRFEVLNTANVRNAEDTAMTGARSKAVFTGFDTVFRGEEVFTFENATTTGQGQMTLDFSGAVVASPSRQSFTVYTRDENHIRRELSVLSVAASGQQVVLSTATHSAGASYFIFVEEDADIASSGTAVSGALARGATGYSPDNFEIFTLSPQSFAAETGGEITITGSALLGGGAATTVRLGSATLEIVSNSEEQIVASVPSTLASGVYGLTLRREDGQEITQNNAVTILEPDAGEVSVVATESFITPSRMAPGTEEIATAWIRVTAPTGADDIDAVRADLRAVNGGASVAASLHEVFSGGAWYMLEFTVPANVSTSETPVQIPVTAVAKTGESDTQNLEITITTDTLQSATPSVLSASASPTRLAPGSTDTVRFFAEISDADGLSDVLRVELDASQIGLGVVSLSRSSLAFSAPQHQLLPRARADAGESVGIFQSSEFTLPAWVEVGGYTLPLRATDTAGQSATGEISFSVSRTGNVPSIDDDSLVFTPSDEIIGDGATSTRVYLRASDADGADDITSAIVDLSPLGVGPLSMVAVSREGLNAWFESPAFVVSEDVARGFYDIDFIVTDTDGGTATEQETIRVSDEDSDFEAPIITSRSYVLPTTLRPDSEETAAAYVFVERGDEAIQTVYATLGAFLEIEKPVGDSDTCVSSPALGCFAKHVDEGEEGTWFVLTGISAKRGAPAGDTLEMNITAVDANGKTDETSLEIYVKAAESTGIASSNAEVLDAVAISDSEVALIFSAPFDASGALLENFRITTLADAYDAYAVRAVSPRSDAMGLTLRISGSFPEDETMVLELNREELGLEGASKILFDPFSESSAPRVQTVTAEDNNLFRVEFTEGLNPTAFDTRGTNFTLSDASSFEQLGITGARLLSANTVRVSTATPLMGGQEYLLRARGLLGASGQEITISGGTKTFRAESLHSVATGADGGGQLSTAEQADLNADGVVDFLDFSLFAQVYETTLAQHEPGSTGTISDLNEDGVIDFLDFVMFSETYSTPQ